MADDEENRSCFRFGLHLIITIFLFTALLHRDFVLSATLKYTNETKIANWVLLTGPCVDGSGVVKSDLEEWPSSPTACDNNICHIEPSGNYVVVEKCPGVPSDQIPDEDNCQQVSDSSKTFPNCCPKLQCSSASPLTTLPPTTCLDLSPTSSCLFWASFDNGCNENGTFYGFVKDFCKKTCGFC